MDHKHEFEVTSRLAVSKEARDLGVRAAEIRKCRTCSCSVVFMETRNGWLPFNDVQCEGEGEILMA